MYRIGFRTLRLKICQQSVWTTRLGRFQWSFRNHPYWQLKKAIKPQSVPQTRFKKCLFYSNCFLLGVFSLIPFSLWWNKLWIIILSILDHCTLSAVCLIIGCLSALLQSHWTGNLESRHRPCSVCLYYVWIFTNFYFIMCSQVTIFINTAAYFHNIYKHKCWYCQSTQI